MELFLQIADEFLVTVAVIQFLGQLAADGTATATQLAADGNDFRNHTSTGFQRG